MTTTTWRAPLLHPLGRAIQAVGKAEQLIAGWMPAVGVTTWLARRGVGKTLVALSQAFAFATDRDWFGKPTARGFWSVYACGEDQENTLANAQAWCVHHGVDINDPKVRWVFIPDVPDLLNKDDCQGFCKAVKDMLPPASRVVTFIDTWQRATARAKMIDDLAMQVCMGDASCIGKDLRGPVVFPVHPPKADNSTIAGSSVVENDTNAIGRIWRSSGSRTKLMLRMERMKGPGEGKTIAVALREMELGERNQLGQPRIGAFVVPRAFTSNEQVEQGLSDSFDDVSAANDDREGEQPEPTVEPDDHGARMAEALKLKAAGHSERDIGEMMGISKSAAHSLLKRRAKAGSAAGPGEPPPEPTKVSKIRA